MKPGSSAFAPRAVLVLLAGIFVGAAKAKPPAQPAPASPATAPSADARDGNAAARDFYTSRYGQYTPGFLPLRNLWFWDHHTISEGSSEKSFNNFSTVDEDSRVNAAIDVARRREEAGEHREAQPLYQDIIEKMPDVLYRVSKDGVFVRAADYCQMRILAMPPADLAFYRTQYDARAADAYAEAERQCSLAGYQEIVDSMLATSYGDKAMMALGRAALDSGRYEEAYRRFNFIKQFFKGGHCDTDELAVLLAYAAKKCGIPAPAVPAGDGSLTEGLKQIRASLPTLTPSPSQNFLRSAPYASGQDYGASPVTDGKPLLTHPVWKSPLPCAWYAKEVYSSPVVTDDSVLIRHHNIVYCYSLLTGALRWKNDLGGSVVWQNLSTLSTPNEELVVADNMVYTNMYKGGPSLVALSLTTGELRWAAGAMASAGEANMRFEAAPVVDGGVVYAGYILDNLEGDTHIDTLYGMRAFDAETGQLLWDRPISRLPVGSSATTVGQSSRIQIRSFATPPAIKEGTLYYSTNAGVIAALDARTGRIKWLIRYPYYLFKASVHDAADPIAPFLFKNGVSDTPGIDMRSSLWTTQPPLLYHNCLYVAPVDCPLLMSIELNTGKVRWSRLKGADDRNLNIVRNFLGPGYIVGPTRGGDLVMVYGSRLRAATVVNADTGKIVWEVPDVLPPEDSLALDAKLTWQGGMLDRAVEVDRAQFQAAARPTLLADDSVVFSSFAYFTFGFVGKAFVYGGARISIPDKTIVEKERYYDAGILSAAETIITTDAPSQMKFFEGDRLKRLKEIAADHMPENPVGAFEPAAIVTAERFGTVFEIRVAPDEISVAYDKSKVEEYLAHGNSASILQARAELALARSDYADSAKLLNECLARVLPQQIALREKIGGLFHALDLHVARNDLLRREYPGFVAASGLLLQTSQTLPQEVQSLLAVAEGDQRAGDDISAARILRDVIEHFGTREYPVTPLLFDRDLGNGLDAVLDQVGREMPTRTYGAEFNTALSLSRDAAPLFAGVLSPADAGITVNVGDLALRRLRALAKGSPRVAQMLDIESRDAFAKADPGEREELLSSYPQTSAGQAAVNEMAAAAKLPGVEGRRQAWRLADVAESAGFQLPDAIREGRPFEPKPVAAPPILAASKTREVNFGPGEILRLILQRRDASGENRQLLFIGGRARKRLDNHFTLECYDVRDGKKLWASADLRLKGIGQEPGFFEVFVHHQMAIVHGLYDVLAFDIADGHLIWRYRVPSDFEIGRVLPAGDLLILAGNRGTLTLYVPTTSAVGDLVWETKEQGDLYAAPYLVGDRLVMVRQSPDNVTVRHLGSGKLVGRIELPGLDSSREQPLLPDGAPAAPLAHNGNLLFLTDGWSYLLIDTASLTVRWKREIDGNDPTAVPPMRIALSDRIAIITKKDYDRSAMYGIDLATGDILWKTDPKDPHSLPPLYDISFNGDIACGISVPAKQSFSVIAFNPQTGEKSALWKPKRYPADPSVRMYPSGDGQSVLLTIMQGQQLQIMALDAHAARAIATVDREGVGPLGTPGLSSAGAFDGHLVLLSKDGFSISE